METKSEIFIQIIEKLKETLKNTKEQASTAAEAAIDAPGRNESRYDSTKEEMSYLSDAFSKKAKEVENNINELINFSLPEKNNIILTGSLVEISINNNKQLIFLIPTGGGQKIKTRNTTVFTISKQAPLFSIVLGKKPGELINFNGKQIIIKKIE